MKYLINTLNKSLKYVLSILSVSIFLAVFVLTACNEPQGDVYTLEFTPNSVTEKVGETFNIFNLHYDTNLPKDIADNLKTYNNVEISAENNSVVRIAEGINEITTLAVGSTKVNVVINYKNEEVRSCFDLIVEKLSDGSEGNTDENNQDGLVKDDSNNSKDDDIDNKSETEGSDKEEFDNGELLKGFTFIYNVENYFDEDGVVIYTLKVTGGEESLLRYNVYVVDKRYSNFVETEIAGVNVCEIWVFTNERIEIEIIGIFSGNRNINLGRIILSCN